MCGLFGFISKDGQKPNISLLQLMALETETRGRHAFGLTWVDPDGEISKFKTSGSASKNLDLLEMCVDALIIVGHCRWATHGDPKDNRNNHPHKSGKGWFAHNGVVHNYEKMIKTFGVQPKTDCDSEVLGLVMNALWGRLEHRAARTIEASTGPLAILGAWNRTMLIARRGNPMWSGETKRGLYMGSLPGELPGKIHEFKDDQVCTMTLRKNNQMEVRRQILRNSYRSVSNQFGW